jgi:hypothetical protein
MNSKHFTEDEIKGITMEDGKKVVYLKPGVKRLKYDYVSDDIMCQINQQLAGFERYLKTMDKLGINNQLEEDSNFN